MNYDIRYLDLTSHQYLAEFKGHTGALRGLCFQPGSAHRFMSAGWDDRVFLWDLRCGSYTQRLKHLQRPLLAIDPSGLVFATCHNAERLEIFDVRKAGGKPCHQFSYQLNEQAKWTQLQFAPDGKNLLVNTDHGWCFSVDAFNGHFRQIYTGYANRDQLPLQACYTSDSQHVLAGSDRGRIHVWRAASGQLMTVLHSKCSQSVHCLQFNPQRSMFASSDVSTRLWLPGKRALPSADSEELPTIDLTRSDLDMHKIRHCRNWPKPIQVPTWPNSPSPAVSRRPRRRMPRMPRITITDDESLEEGEIPCATHTRHQSAGH